MFIYSDYILLRMASRDVSVPKENYYSLKAQLEALGQLKGSGLELVIKDAEGEWHEGKKAQNQVFAHFYEENPLAYAVAQGKESYVKRIEFIEERYDAVWKKLKSPAPDSAFDSNVHEVIGSLNGVGVKPISPYLFESGGLLKGYSYLYPLPFAGLVAGFMSISAVEMKGGLSLAFGVAALGVMGVGLDMPYKRVRGINRLLGELHDAAQQTDDFLRSNYALREM